MIFSKIFTTDWSILAEKDDKPKATSTEKVCRDVGDVDGLNVSDGTTDGGTDGFCERLFEGKSEGLLEDTFEGRKDGGFDFPTEGLDECCNEGISLEDGAIKGVRDGYVFADGTLVLCEGFDDGDEHVLHVIGQFNIAILDNIHCSTSFATIAQVILPFLFNTENSFGLSTQPQLLQVTGHLSGTPSRIHLRSGSSLTQSQSLVLSLPDHNKLNELGVS